ncbi:MAG: type II secretion system protein [Proteobacteria bacterium]|nr:type II secretion system protein [Pseudomonadota bacterium]
MKNGAAAAKAGFSLAEAALSLAIVGMVITAMVPALLSLRASESARATQTALEGVMRATAAFVQANGCFPCPAPASLQAGAGFGVVRGDTLANPSPCNSGCASVPGLVPFRSLGLPQSLAHDGYGRWLTFAVDPTLTSSGLSNLACTIQDTDCTADDVAHSAHKKGLCAAGLGASTSLRVLVSGVTTTIAMLVLSHGANGRGAFTEVNSGPARRAFPTSVPSCLPGNTGAERCNADADLTFVAAIPSTGSDPFDDQMLYFDRNALMASLGGAGCNTNWLSP